MKTYKEIQEALDTTNKGPNFKGIMKDFRNKQDELQKLMKAVIKTAGGNKSAGFLGNKPFMKAVQDSADAVTKEMNGFRLNVQAFK